MKKIFYFCSLLLLTLVASCTDADGESLSSANPEAMIAQSDELYQLVERNANPDPDTISVTCVRFQYPITVYVYGSATSAVASHSIPDDAFFYAFLTNLDEGFAISIGYPVNVINTDDVVTEINNNDELQAAIISCVEDQQIAWAEELFAPVNNNCVWQVGHSAFWEGFNATYTGGYFTPQPDGTLTFYYDETYYNGTWSFEATTLGLQLSITLENPDMAQYWNHSYPVVISDETIELGEENGTRILTRLCETTETYTIGQIGPEGGRVFYDKGEYSYGWRYMEVEMTEVDTLLQWGCNAIGLGNTYTGIGTGLTNSGKIKTFFDNLPGYYTNPIETCSENADGTVAASFGLYINNNKQWFLPSKEELQLVYQNLAGLPTNNFGNYYYWTSSEVDAETAWAVHFGNNGEPTALAKYEAGDVQVRRVRYF